MNHTQAIAELLQKAESLLAQGDARQAAILLDKILRLDFVNPTAWQLLHQMLGKGESLDEFQRAFAQAHYPSRAHLLEAPDLIPLSTQTEHSDSAPLPDGEESTPQPPQISPTEDAEGKICAYCGRVNPPGEPTCLLCGAALAQPVSTTPPSPSPQESRAASPKGEREGEGSTPPPVNFICRACGYVNRPPSRFCTQCGASLVKSDQPAPTPPAQIVIPSWERAGEGSTPPPQPPPQPVILQVREPAITPPAQVVTPSPIPPPPTSPSGGSRSTPDREGGREGVEPAILQAHEPPVTPPQQVVVPVPAPTPTPPPPPVDGGVACPNCGRHNPPGARLCAFCSYDFASRQPLEEKPASKEKPRLIFHFVDLGDFLVLASLLLPWASIFRNTFLGNKTTLYNGFQVMAEFTGGGNINVAVILFFLLGLGASILVRARQKILAVIAALGALAAQVYALTTLSGISGQASGSAGIFFDLSTVRVREGAIIGLVGGVFILAGVLFFEGGVVGALWRFIKRAWIPIAVILSLFGVIAAAFLLPPYIEQVNRSQATQQVRDRTGTAQSIQQQLKALTATEAVYQRNRTNFAKTAEKAGQDNVNRTSTSAASVKTSTPTPIQATTAPSTIQGTWTGSYLCGQGATGLKLEIVLLGAQKIEATFNFYALPENSGVPSGSYKMQGTFNSATNAVQLTGSQWINRPSNWNMVNLSGQLKTQNNQMVIEGEVSTCKTFSVSKK